MNLHKTNLVIIPEKMQLALKLPLLYIPLSSVKLRLYTYDDRHYYHSYDHYNV